MVLGRSAGGRWLYVRDEHGTEGFVYEPRFEWTGDFDGLTVIPASVVTQVPTRPAVTVAPLEIDLWSLPGTERCEAGVWYKTIYIQGHGGDGVYTYYWSGEVIAGPMSEGYTFEIHGAGGAIVSTGRVVSGDGQVAEQGLYVTEPECHK
jgi:hypothetical protein